MPRINALATDMDTYSHDPSRYRRQFLHSIRKTTPEVLEALRDDVFPGYTSAALFRVASVKLEFLKTPLGSPKPSPDEIAAFKRRLEAWVCRFSLSDQWLLEVALMTLERWKNASAELAALNWAGLPFRPPPLPPEGREFDFHDDGWHLEDESSSEFASRVMAAFKQQLVTYKDAIRESMRELGLSLPPEIRQPEHYDWLVLYQVRGLSPAQIADLMSTDKKTLTDSTVFKAVSKTAELVGLRLRPPKKGKGPKLHRRAPKHRRAKRTT
jgi:hypothetical protein